MKARKVYEAFTFRPKSAEEAKASIFKFMGMPISEYNQIYKLFKYEFKTSPRIWIQYLQEYDFKGIYTRDTVEKGFAYRVAFDDIDTFKHIAPREEWPKIETINATNEGLGDVLKGKPQDEVDADFDKMYKDKPEEGFMQMIQLNWIGKVKKYLEENPDTRVYPGIIMGTITRNDVEMTDLLLKYVYKRVSFDQYAYYFKSDTKEKMTEVLNKHGYKTSGYFNKRGAYISMKEGLEDVLKPKDTDLVAKEFAKLNPQEQFNKAIELNMMSKVKELYYDRKNVDPLWGGGRNIDVAMDNGFDDILRFYMDHPEGWASNNYFIKDVFTVILNSAKAYGNLYIVRYAENKLFDLGINEGIKII